MTDNTLFLLDRLPRREHALSRDNFFVAQFSRLHQLLSGGLRWQNLRSSLPSVPDSGLADTPFIVTHNLGKIPEVVLVATTTKAGSLYANSTDQSAWTTAEVTLRYSSANAALTLLIL